MTGIVIFAHGSRIESANAAVRDVAQRLAESENYQVEPAFLELGKPDLAGAVEFDRPAAVSNIQSVRPGMPILEVSAKTGAGMYECEVFLGSRRIALIKDVQPVQKSS